MHGTSRGTRIGVAVLGGFALALGAASTASAAPATSPDQLAGQVTEILPNGLVRGTATNTAGPSDVLQVRLLVDGNYAGGAAARDGSFEVGLSPDATNGQPHQVQVQIVQPTPLPSVTRVIYDSPVTLNNAAPDGVVDTRTDTADGLVLTGWSLDRDRLGQALPAERLKLESTGGGSPEDESCTISVQTGIARTDVPAALNLPSANGDPYGWQLTATGPGCPTAGAPVLVRAQDADGNPWNWRILPSSAPGVASSPDPKG